MAEVRNCKVLVVGAGPGGYVAAIRAGQLGLDTIIVEGSRAGGTCLIRGCIPSKAMIHAASSFEELGQHSGAGKMGISVTGKPKVNMPDLVSWKESIVDKLNKGVETLLKAAKVELISGWAKFRNAKTCEVSGGEKEWIINAEHVILANGSKSIELPFMPYGDNVISSTEGLELQELPKRLVVIGAGYIGLELGIAYRKLGSEVTFIEALDTILPIYDTEMTRPISMWLRKHKVTINLGAKAKGVSTRGKVTTVEYTDSKGQDHKIKDREPATINPQDAADRGIAHGDIVRLFNDRGACLAGAQLSDDVMRGVIQLSTGAWYDPLNPGEPGSLDVHGNPNVLTLDKGTSKLAQGPSAMTALVEVEPYIGEPPPVKVFMPPEVIPEEIH